MQYFNTCSGQNNSCVGMGALQNIFVLQVAKAVEIIELDTAKGRDGALGLILTSAECGLNL